MYCPLCSYHAQRPLACVFNGKDPLTPTIDFDTGNIFHMPFETYGKIVNHHNASAAQFAYDLRRESNNRFPIEPQPC